MCERGGNESVRVNKVSTIYKTDKVTDVDRCKVALNKWKEVEYNREGKGRRERKRERVPKSIVLESFITQPNDLGWSTG